MNVFKRWFGRRQVLEFPDFIKKYHASLSELDLKIPADLARYVVFDTETTSLNTKTAKIYSIGAVSISDRQIKLSETLDCFVNWSVNEERPSNVEIHGITHRQLSEGVDPEEAIKAFIQLIEGSVLVAHHAKFDMGVINQTLHKYYKGFQLHNPFIDTIDLAKRLELGPYSQQTNEKYNLDALLDRYDIKALERHSSLGDAYSTALLFLKLTSKLRDRGILKLKDLIN